MAEETFNDSAMIALIPSDEDAKRLAVDGYQSPDDLHVTLVFLGEADKLDGPTRTALEAGVRRLAAAYSTMPLRTWSTSHFNPKGDKPCAVYLVGEGEDRPGHLEDLAEGAYVLANREVSDLPEQHTPWIPHLTIGYDLDPSMLDESDTDVLFDRLRLALGDENIDVALAEPIVATAWPGLAFEIGMRLQMIEERLPGALVAAPRAVGLVQRAAREFNELLHPRGKDGRFIEKNGFVSAEVPSPKGRGQTIKVPRARVRGFRDNPTDPKDPLVEIELPDGTVTETVASKASRAAAPKARLSTPNAPKALDDSGAVEVSSAKRINRETPTNVLREGTPQDMLDFLSDATADLDAEDPEVRAAQLDEVMAKAFRSPLDTDQVHNRRGAAQDQWSPERMAFHEQLWENLISQVESSGIPKDRDALVLGGLPGAGKSSTLKPGGAAESLGVRAWDPIEDMPDAPTHVSINPDSIKEMLIDAGGLPEGLPENLKPMEAVTFIHEESSALSKQWLKRLSDEGYNVVLDNTMESADSMMRRMTPLASEGYSFRGLFVDIPVDESKLSAKRRYQRSFNTAKGGRFVPSAVQHGKSSTRGKLSPNRDAFDALAGINEDNTTTGSGWFKSFMVIDNTGVASGSPAKVVVVQGTGDGAPAAELAALASPAPAVV